MTHYAPLQLYTVFHLNLAYSSIDESQHAEVVKKCYWPLLRLARDLGIPFGIEATVFTLECIEKVDPTWLAELRGLNKSQKVEFVGSGYAQVIGPIVPASVNQANLRLGNVGYEKLLGSRPTIALINEQAYSSGLVPNYLNAGYKAIVMDWDNPFRLHPDWDADFRYYSQVALGTGGSKIPVLWSHSIVFQKFQRYAHGEVDLAEFLGYINTHRGPQVRALPLYGNDVEVFDYRPGRYHTEAALQTESEWQRIAALLRALLEDPSFVFVPPSKVFSVQASGLSGRELELASAVSPVPVKKQSKYNVTRWAVSGRDDLGLNTRCYRVARVLSERAEKDDFLWRELCFVLSSDFRTHIGDQRWADMLSRLDALEDRVGLSAKVPRPALPAKLSTILPKSCTAERDGRFLLIRTPSMRVQLNMRRGLAMEKCWFGQDGVWTFGTLPHGYYEDINWGADFYSGNVVFEAPGQPKVTDLEPVTPTVEFDPSREQVVVRGQVDTKRGPVRKVWRIGVSEALCSVTICPEWGPLPIGSLRLGAVTLNPEAFRRSSLEIQTHNGGHDLEVFPLTGETIHYGQPVSFLVSASQGFGVTEGLVRVRDGRRTLTIEVDKTAAAVVGLLDFERIGDTYFLRVKFSAREMDETSRPEISVSKAPLEYTITLRPE